MSVHYLILPASISRDREHVSEEWYLLMLAVHDDGVRFNVNEGHRTKRRQAELVAEKGLWSPSNPTGAAAVSDNAPHIRTGRPDHANDLDGVDAFIAGARRHGVTVRRTIPTEDWHVEADRAQLHAYAKRERARHRRALKAATAAYKRAVAVLKRARAAIR